MSADCHQFVQVLSAMGRAHTLVLRFMNQGDPAMLHVWFVRDELANLQNSVMASGVGRYLRIGFIYSRVISKSPLRVSPKSAPTMKISQAKRSEKIVLSLKVTFKNNAPSSME